MHAVRAKDVIVRTGPKTRYARHLPANRAGLNYLRINSDMRPIVLSGRLQDPRIAW